MWCRRRMKKISWTEDHVRNEETIYRIQEERDIL
jgi:hypothetical protein